MVRFAHISDVHLGGWRQPEMQEVNFLSFQRAVDVCVERKLDFVLIAGDLFDTAYPSIEILKGAFAEFKRLKDAGIPCFIIAGSHDYSVSGKTFLDVLEKAGFCVHAMNFEERDEKIVLNPVCHKGVAIYGYPGKKSGLEIPDLRRVSLNDSPGMFKIFMFHTTIDKARGNLPMDAIEADSLPSADYYALGHLHIDFRYKNFVYPGPVFPNNFQELEDLRHGSFYIVDTDSVRPLEKINLNVRDVVPVNFEVKDTHTATEEIIGLLNGMDIRGKIVLLRLVGLLNNQTVNDIDFVKIEGFAKQRGVYFLLKNTHNLKVKETDLNVEVRDSKDVENDVVRIYSQQNPSDFNGFVPELLNSLAIGKQEGETTANFERRVIESAKKIFGF